MRARAKADQPPLTAATLLEFFQPLGSSLPQKERPKSSKVFSLTERLLGLSSDIMHRNTLAIQEKSLGHSQTLLKTCMSSLTREETPMR